MSATLLEQTRAAHEEVEKVERLVVKDMQTESKSHKERLHQSHRVANMLEAIMTNTARLVSPCFLSCRVACGLSAQLSTFYWLAYSDLHSFWQIEIYEDRDNARKDEIADLGGQSASGQNVFSVFYERLKQVF